MNYTFVRWYERGRWSRWHLVKPGTLRYTLCGHAIGHTLQLKELGYCDCGRCSNKEAKR